MICINPNSIEFKQILAEVGDPLYAEVEYAKRYGLSDLEVNYQLATSDEIIVSEKTLRDIAARMSDRIGIQYKVISDRTQQFKGKLEGNTAIINLAYASLDTPIHEILGHPIIRALKTGTESNKQLYQNLLKELETGKGKEVLDRVKRDYQYKDSFKEYSVYDFESEQEAKKAGAKFDRITEDGEAVWKKQDIYSLEEQQEEAIVELLGLYTADKLDKVKDGKLISFLKRLLKEIKAFMKQLLKEKEVEIEKLPDSMTLEDLSDLLAYSNSKLILPGNEVVYTTPDNQQFKTYAEANKHISDLAKSVKEVDLSDIELDLEYPSYFEAMVYPFDASPYVSHIFKKENGKFYITIDNHFLHNITKPFYDYETGEPEFREVSKEEYEEKFESLKDRDVALSRYSSIDTIKDFVEKNKQYEQSKEIIEEWKKVNNIQYNPEEIYSRGQEFTSVVGAYSNFDVNLMMQNLLQHIEDNEKAGGKFTISAFTKPIDREIGHLEGGGGKIKFKIYPQSKDILWAANTDVYSGSVWDASKKVNKDKKSELLGVSYTKYPSISAINSVQPNLASIVDNLVHHHNELGINLTGNNFRLEYDKDVPYSTKKIIDSINSILDEKYGKLVKPKIEKGKKQSILIDNPLSKNERSGVISYSSDYDGGYFLDTIYGYERKGYAHGNKISYFKVQKILKTVYPNSDVTIQPITKKVLVDGKDVIGYPGLKYQTSDKIKKEVLGVQPTQTNETLKESIESVKDKKIQEFEYTLKPITKEQYDKEVEKSYEFTEEGETYFVDVNDTTRYMRNSEGYFEEKAILKPKEYTSQALINTKIAKLKEVAKKYPRSLIRSEVVPVNLIRRRNRELGLEEMFEDELPFQKIRSEQAPIKPGVPELFESNFLIFAESKTSEEVMSKLLANKIIDKKCS